MAHIKATQAANPALMFKDILKKAGQTYKKGKSLVTNSVKRVVKSKKMRKVKKSKKTKSKSIKSKKSKKSRKSKK